MNIFTKDQKVRITPKFAEGHEDSDGSFASKVGVEGTVRVSAYATDNYVAVQLPGEDFPWLFLHEELETV